MSDLSLTTETHACLLSAEKVAEAMIGFTITLCGSLEYVSSSQIFIFCPRVTLHLGQLLEDGDGTRTDRAGSHLDLEPPLLPFVASSHSPSPTVRSTTAPESVGVYVGWDIVRLAARTDAESNSATNTAIKERLFFSMQISLYPLSHPIPSRPIPSHSSILARYSRHAVGSGAHLLVLLDQRRRSIKRERERAMKE